MTHVAGMTGTAARAIAIGTIGAAALAPTVLAQNSYNVRAEGRVAAPTTITRTSAMLNAWIQNPSGQQSRIVFTVGTSPRRLTRSVPAGRWSTSRAPRRVSGTIRGLRPNTRYTAKATVQVRFLTRTKPARYTIRSRAAGTVTFRTAR
jgi:hypothetical protein